MGLSTLKICCQCLEQFPRQSPGTSTDRQREGGRERQTENANLYPQYKSPEYELDVRQLSVVNWRRAKIVGHLCEVYHFAPLPLPRAFSRNQRLCNIHNTLQHSKSCIIEKHSLNCISVPNFALLPQNFQKVKMSIHVHSARAVHVDYAPNHRMQCTMEFHTLNSIGVPHLVSLAQNLLEPKVPSNSFFGPGACSLHPTTTAPRKAHRCG